MLRGAASVPEGKCYADNDGRMLSGSWLVTAAFGGGVQRYWIGSDCFAASSRLVSASEGAGYEAYATPDGFVVRGAWADPSTGLVYLADNDGRLAPAGWVVSSAYGQGTQRYWVDAESRACRPGFSADGYAHYTTSAGYVLRGVLNLGSFVAIADNDGAVPASTGWLVSSAYGQGIQRYWLIDVSESGSYSAARVGLISFGDNKYYGTKAGHVAINCNLWVSDDYYNANCDGLLAVIDNAYSRYVKRYVGWMLSIAADDSHGYDQQYRWGERGDYDCSSLVISALRVAGLDTGGATYTGNMRSQLCAHHFVWITDFSQLQRGDILLNEAYHTAVYLGEDTLVHASGNEFEEAVGGRPGDQTGKEICVRSYYWRPWNGFLRLVI